MVFLVRTLAINVLDSRRFARWLVAIARVSVSR